MARKKQPKPTDPRTIRVQVREYTQEKRFDGYELEGSLDDVIAKLTTFRDSLPDSKLFLNWEHVPYSGGDYAMYVYEERLETPEEVGERLEKETAYRTAQEERERAEFERLSKKFGG